MPSSLEGDASGRDRDRERRYSPGVRFAVQFSVPVLTLALLVGTATAANGLTLSKQSQETLAVPQWLYLATGGAAIGVSALLASFVTDRAFIRYLHTWSRVRRTDERWWKPLGLMCRGIGGTALILTVYLGFTGPELPTASLTILLAFAGVRAGLPIVAYLFGNVWPVLNPWRTIATVLPSGFRAYPAGAARWPAVAGWLGLVWVEVIFPVSTVPGTLASLVVIYSVVTISGAVVFGPDTWFRNADPLSVLFQFYGAVGPLEYDRNEGFTLRLPGSALRDAEIATDTSDVAFLVVLIWELTYSGFITTSAGAATVEVLVSLAPGAGEGVWPIHVYTVLFIVGYALCFGMYWGASRLSRRTTGTYVTARTIALRFGPPLAAIAAGYHLAHYAGLFVSLSPALTAAVLSPLSPPANPTVLSIPSWFSASSIAFVLVGHLVAVWAAHAAAYELFSSRLVAIRSQYPFIVVMVGYTVASLWLLSLPGATPPYLP